MAFERKKKKYRSPVEGPLRRLPGQSVRDQRDKLLHDRFPEYLFLVSVSWLLAGWEWFRRWYALPYGAEILTAYAVIITIYCVFQFFRLRKEIKNLNLGEKGERRVSELLRTLRDKDYVTFDDLLLEGVNVDHVVVGPGGVYAIETKARTVFDEGRISFDENGELKLSGREVMGDPLKQACGCAAKVSAELERHLHRKMWVDPVIVFPGWQIDPPKLEREVVVLNDKTISEFFKTRPQKLSASEIREICSHLDRSARS